MQEYKQLKEAKNLISIRTMKMLGFVADGVLVTSLALSPNYSSASEVKSQVTEQNLVALSDIHRSKRATMYVCKKLKDEVASIALKS